MADGDASPHRTRVDVSFGDRDAAHEWLREAYADLRPTVAAGGDDFSFRQVSTGDEAFSAGWMRYSKELVCAAEPFPFYIVGHKARGRLRLGTHGTEIVPETGGLFLCPPAPMDVHCDDYELGQVQLERHRVERIASEVGGIRPGALRFDTLRPGSPARQRHWTAALRHVVRDVLGSDDVMASPLARSEAFRQLTVAMLLTFPNNATAAPPPAERPEPAAVRRAVSYIDSHAAEDITLSDIAAAARIGPRGLQQAFRRHLDMTPLAYLRRARVRAAHAELRAGDPTRGDTVAGIALRWGFANPGRFAAAYREQYGASPSSTLRR